MCVDDILIYVSNTVGPPSTLPPTMRIRYYMVFVLGHQILDLHGFPRTTQILEKIVT